MQHGSEQTPRAPFSTCNGHLLSLPRDETARPRIREQTCEPGGFRLGYSPAQLRQAIVTAALVVMSRVWSLAQFFDQLGFE